MSVLQATSCRWCQRWMVDVGTLMLCPHCDAATLTTWRGNHA